MMDLSSINPILLLASIMVAATPILLAAIGELVVERAGVLNLGVEGMMITGAICGFAFAVNTGSPALGFLGRALGGAGLSLLFALLTQFALANQVASGLALTLFGLGLSALLGQGYVGIKPPPTARLDIPVLGDIPFLGPVLFSHDPMVYIGLALVAAVWAGLKYTRAGLILRAVGENHDAAHALGYKVVRVRVLAIAVRRCLRRTWRGLSQPRSGAAMDRGHDRRCGLDRAGAGCLRQLEGGARLAGRLAFRRRQRAAAQPSGRRCRAAGRISFDVALPDHHPRAGHHVGGPQPRARVAGPNFPCLAMRRCPSSNHREINS